MLQGKCGGSQANREENVPGRRSGLPKVEAEGRIAELCFLLLRRVGESDYSDGEEDFYYTEIKLNTDSMSEGLAPVSPSQSLTSPPTFPVPDCSRTEAPCAKTDPKPMTPLSRSAPTTLYLVHTDHAYQVTC